MSEIRLPNINGSTEQEQLTQIKSYLYQLTGQLNYALNQVNAELAKNQEDVIPTGANGLNEAAEKEKQNQFNELKNLIIKSADTVQAFEDIVTQKLEGNYVATSEFGDYTKKTDAQLKETSENATTAYTSVQTIEDKVNNLSIMRKDGCYIKTGWLNDDNSIAGFEVGQYETKITKDADGNEKTTYTDKGFARFTTDRLSFYDNNGSELAYFAKYVMHIMNAEIKQNLQLGGYSVDLTDGVAFKWSGRGDD